MASISPLDPQLSRLDPTVMVLNLCTGNIFSIRKYLHVHLD